MSKKPTVTPLTIATMISMFKYTLLALIILLIGGFLLLRIVGTSDDAIGWLLVFDMVAIALAAPIAIFSLVTGIIYTNGIFGNKPNRAFISCLIYSIISGIFSVSVLIYMITSEINSNYHTTEALLIIAIAVLLLIGLTALHIATLFKLRAIKKSAGN